MLGVVSKLIGMSVFVVATLSGCARLTSIHRTTSIPGGMSISVDAKQRFVFAGKQHKSDLMRICAEPSPDAIQALSAAADGSLAYKEVTAKLAGSLAESVGYIGLRTQSIQLLRDAYYRLCESYVSGALSGPAYLRELDRYRRSMITLLAIEQLTRPLQVPPIIIGTSSEAGTTAKDLVELENAALKAEEDESSKADEAATKKASADKDSKTVKEAEGKLEAAKTGGKADEIKKAEDALAEAKQAATKSKEASEAASKAAATATEKRKRVEKLLSQAASTVSAQSTALPGTIGTLPAASRQSAAAVSKVAEVVKDLVHLVYHDDDRVQFCLEHLRDVPAARQSGDREVAVTLYCQLYLESLFDEQVNQTGDERGAPLSNGARQRLELQGVPLN